MGSWYHNLYQLILATILGGGGLLIGSYVGVKGEGWLKGVGLTMAICGTGILILVALGVIDWWKWLTSHAL